MICGMGASQQSKRLVGEQHPRTGGATVYVEKYVDAPFVKQKGRMDLNFRDARNPQYAFIDVAIPTGWAPNDAEADRQLGYPLRI